MRGRPYLYLGAAAQKHFTDKNRSAKITEMSLEDILKSNKETFVKKTKLNVRSVQVPVEKPVASKNTGKIRH